jgi:hypothetical protein
MAISGDAVTRRVELANQRGVAGERSRVETPYLLRAMVNARAAA